MNKLIISLITLLAGALNGFSQNQVTDSTATCVAYWEKGDVKNLLISKTRKTIDNGKTKDDSGADMEAQLTVLDARENGYTLQWVYKPSPTLAKTLTSQNLNSFFPNLKIIYTTDETGIFDSLVNYKEVKSFVNSALEQWFKKGTGSPATDLILKEMKNTLQTREAIEQLLLQEISLFHTPYGVEYSSTSPQRVEAEITNFLGGEPFPATLTVKMTRLDTTADLAIFSMVQEIDQQKAAKIIYAFLDKAASSTNDKIPADVKKNAIIINDDNQFHLELSTGWLKKINYKREVRVGDMYRVDATEITVRN